MSCTVVAVPVLLFQVVTTLVAAKGHAGLAAMNLKRNEQEYLDLLNTSYSETNDDNRGFTINNIIEKDFETPFMDKEVLLKTLTEHGVSNIYEDSSGKVTGIVDSFSLLLEKPSEEMPYHLKITCKQDDDAEEKVNDLASEYALNVQEAAYLSIIEKLKENNMQIESESVEDDNTIVLTINLE